MLASLTADAVVLVHLAFIVFVILGGLLVLRWRWIAVLHLPALFWGATVQFSHGVCPLTPLEQRLRHAAGEGGYEGGFIEHYVMPLIYPAGLNDATQLVLGWIVVALNITLYVYVIRRQQ